MLNVVIATEHAVIGLLPFIGKRKFLAVYEKGQKPTLPTSPLFIKLPLPDGLKKLLKELSFQILRHHPVDMYGYLATYLEEKMNTGQAADLDKTDGNGASEMYHAKEAKQFQKSSNSLLSENKNIIIQNENTKLEKKSDKIFKGIEAFLPSMKSAERKKYASYKAFSRITEEEEGGINDTVSSLQNDEKNGSGQYCKSGDDGIELKYFEENYCKNEKLLNNNFIFKQDKKVNDSCQHYNLAIKNIRTDVSKIAKDGSQKITFKKTPLLRDISCQADIIKNKNKMKKDNCINLINLKINKSDKHHFTIDGQHEKRKNGNRIKFFHRVEPGQLASTFEILTEVQELKRINIMCQESESVVGVSEKPVCQVTQHIDIVGNNDQTLQSQLHLNIAKTVQIESSKKGETCIEATSNSLAVNYKKEKFNTDYGILLERSCNSETIQRCKQKMISGHKTNFGRNNLKNQALIKGQDNDVEVLSEYRKNKASHMQDEVNTLPNDNQNCPHSTLPVSSNKNSYPQLTSVRCDESTLKNKIHNIQEGDQYLFEKLQFQSDAGKINTFQATFERNNNEVKSNEAQDFDRNKDVSRLHFLIEYEHSITKSEDASSESGKETMNYEDLLHAIDSVLEKNANITGSKNPKHMITEFENALLRESENRAETAIKEALNSPSLLNEVKDCTEIQYVRTGLLKSGTSRIAHKLLNSKKTGKNKNRTKIFNFEQILKHNISNSTSSSKRIFKKNRNKFNVFEPNYRYKKSDLHDVKIENC